MRPSRSPLRVRRREAAKPYDDYPSQRFLFDYTAFRAMPSHIQLLFPAPNMRSQHRGGNRSLVEHFAAEWWEETEVVASRPTLGRAQRLTEGLAIREYHLSHKRKARGLYLIGV